MEGKLLNKKIKKNKTIGLLKSLMCIFLKLIKNEKNKKIVNRTETENPIERMFTNIIIIKKRKLNRKLKKTNIKDGILINTINLGILLPIAPNMTVSGTISIKLESTIPTGNFSLSKVVFLNKVRSLYFGFLLKLNNSALIIFSFSFSVLFRYSLKKII